MEAKEKLFKQLLETSPTKQHLENLGELLNIWREEKLWHDFMCLLINRSEFVLFVKKLKDTKGMLTLEVSEISLKFLKCV